MPITTWPARVLGIEQMAAHGVHGRGVLPHFGKRRREVSYAT